MIIHVTLNVFQWTGKILSLKHLSCVIIFGLVIHSLKYILFIIIYLNIHYRKYFHCITTRFICYNSTICWRIWFFFPFNNTFNVIRCQGYSQWEEGSPPPSPDTHIPQTHIFLKGKKMLMVHRVFMLWGTMLKLIRDANLQG